MSTQHFDTSKPRYSMEAPSTEESPGGRVCPYELSVTEAAFFLALGYTVTEAVWDGARFKEVAVYRPLKQQEM